MIQHREQSIERQSIERQGSSEGKEGNRAGRQWEGIAVIQHREQSIERQRDTNVNMCF